MQDGYDVRVASGACRDGLRPDLAMPHRWTDAGVVAAVSFTGAHLLHLAVAGCVLTDVHREAVGLGMPVEGVLVECRGGFDTETWRSTGIRYRVEMRSPAPADDVERLLRRVDDVAEIPAALRHGSAGTREP